MRITSKLDDDAHRLVQAFLASVAASDGEPPLSEYKEMHLGLRRGVTEIMAVDEDGSVAGYGQAAWHRGVSDGDGHWAIEIVISPEQREGRLARKVLEALVDAVGSDPMTLWARVGYVAEMAEAAGWHRSRRLLRMTRSLPAPCSDDRMVGFSYSTFRPGVDEEAWLEANNLAFAGHPENGALVLEDLQGRMSQGWFDPAGLFLAWQGGRVAGSCWTKVHADGTGEIYIIGVVPAWEGRGLGFALLCRGLEYLSRVKGATRAMLYAEASNERAAALYERLGFIVEKRISAYRREQRAG